MEQLRSAGATSYCLYKSPSEYVTGWYKCTHVYGHERWNDYWIAYGQYYDEEKYNPDPAEDPEIARYRIT
ncbi:MAG: hypothetical protein WAJ93_13025 [Candidatus Nitrosopolaris sp.]